MLRPLRFISSNERKINEYRELLDPIDFIPLQVSVPEPQGENPAEVVRAKLLQAFALKRTPLFVDHTSIYIDAWNNLPGALTGIFWHRLGPEGFLRLLNCVLDRRVVARTIIGYCDGKRIYTFEGELTGVLATEARGKTESWNCIFIPDGEQRTLGELTREEKNKISMRRHAAEKFKAFLLSQ